MLLELLFSVLPTSISYWMITNGTIIWCFESVIHFSVLLFIEINQHQMADYVRLNHVLCSKIVRVFFFIINFFILVSLTSFLCSERTQMEQMFPLFDITLQNLRTATRVRCLRSCQYIRFMWHQHLHEKRPVGRIQESAALNKGHMVSQPKIQSL